MTTSDMLHVNYSIAVSAVKWIKMKVSVQQIRTYIILIGLQDPNTSVLDIRNRNCRLGIVCNDGTLF